MRVTLYLKIVTVLLSTDIPSALSAPSLNPATVKRFLGDIKSDRIPKNALEATQYLDRHSGRLRDTLLEEFYKTDEQGREILFNILLDEPSFKPDQKFRAAMLRRLHHWGRPEVEVMVDAAGSLIAEYIMKNIGLFLSELGGEIGTDDPFAQAAITGALAKNRKLGAFAKFYTHEVLTKLSQHLRHNNFDGDAQQAAFTLFLLGEDARGVLSETSRSKDRQARHVARTLLLYLNRKISVETVAERLDDGDGGIWLNSGHLEGEIPEPTCASNPASPTVSNWIRGHEIE